MSADAVAAAVTLTNDCIKDGNAVEATSKASASAWRSSQVLFIFKPQFWALFNFLTLHQESIAWFTSGQTALGLHSVSTGHCKVQGNDAFM